MIEFRSRQVTFGDENEQKCFHCPHFNNVISILLQHVTGYMFCVCKCIVNS